MMSKLSVIRKLLQMHTTVLLGAVLLAGFCGTAAAETFLPDLWIEEYTIPNRSVDVCNELRLSSHQPQGCVLCHTSGGSSSDLNDYAQDIKAAHDLGGTWREAFVAVELDDSDGDGFSNVDEILVHCSFPGDLLSVPVEKTTWGQIKALYQ